jgi:hypothetical protein
MIDVKLGFDEEISFDWLEFLTKIKSSWLCVSRDQAQVTDSQLWCWISGKRMENRWLNHGLQLASASF